MVNYRPDRENKNKNNSITIWFDVHMIDGQLIGSTIATYLDLFPIEVFNRWIVFFYEASRDKLNGQRWFANTTRPKHHDFEFTHFVLVVSVSCLSPFTFTGQPPLGFNASGLVIVGASSYISSFSVLFSNCMLFALVYLVLGDLFGCCWYSLRLCVCVCDFWNWRFRWFRRLRYRQ